MEKIRLTAVINFASFDIISIISGKKEPKLHMDDVLLIYATFMTRLCFEELKTIEKLPLVKNIEYFLSKGIRKQKVLSYTKESTSEFMFEYWLHSLSEVTKRHLLEGIKLIESIDSDGYVCVNEKLLNAYKSLCNKGHEPIQFGNYNLDFDGPYPSLDASGVKLPNALSGHNLWLWKCINTSEILEYPNELKCVGNNEWLNNSIATYKSLKDFALFRQEQKAKLGTVTHAWWDFYKNMKIGDFVVLLNSDTNEINGFARITSDYRFVEDLPEYRHRRSIEWLSKEHYECLYRIGSGNTWPMPIFNPDRLNDLLPYLDHVLNK